MSMPNYLTMPKQQQILALLALGWSYRRIEAETGVRRETISRYDQRRANAAKTFPGSDRLPPQDSVEPGAPHESKAAKAFAGSGSNAATPFLGSARPRFSATIYREAITEKLDAGLTVQRIWQDLVEEYGYGASYESVKRFVRTIAPTRRAVGVFHCAPGAEAQVDFFRGAPTLERATGEWRRPWVFRMTLGHSRHGYEEAVWDQKLATFLGLHERAFRDFGGVWSAKSNSSFLLRPQANPDRCTRYHRHTCFERRSLSSLTCCASCGSCLEHNWQLRICSSGSSLRVTSNARSDHAAQTTPRELHSSSCLNSSNGVSS